MKREVIKLKNDFEDTLYGIAWTCNKPKANVMIFTGMQETASRYDDFAKFLNENHYDVYCLDHYGQGLNIKDGDVRGLWPDSGFSKQVKTFGQLEVELKNTGLPTYIFAHSMGSFMAQEYIQRFHTRVNKTVICGSDYANPFLMKFAYLLSLCMVNKKNQDLPNKTLAKLVTGNFAKAIKNRKTDFDWLSYNTDNVKRYIDDPKCGFIATGRFYREFLKGMARISKKMFLRKVRRTTPIFIIAGVEDPVGHMGKGPMKLEKVYKSYGLKNVKLKLYPNMRHEILNENNNREVYKDILEFFDKEDK